MTAATRFIRVCISTLTKYMNIIAISIRLLVLLDLRYITRRSCEICGNSGVISFDLLIKQNKPFDFNSGFNHKTLLDLLTQFITFYFLSHYICDCSVSTVTRQSDIWLEFKIFDNYRCLILHGIQTGCGAYTASQPAVICTFLPKAEK
jgi:hypothetical protein